MYTFVFLGKVSLETAVSLYSGRTPFKLKLEPLSLTEVSYDFPYSVQANVALSFYTHLFSGLVIQGPITSCSEKGLKFYVCVCVYIYIVFRTVYFYN
jgi:hypothetical protein